MEKVLSLYVLAEINATGEISLEPYRWHPLDWRDEDDRLGKRIVLEQEITIEIPTALRDEMVRETVQGLMAEKEAIRAKSFADLARIDERISKITAITFQGEEG